MSRTAHPHHFPSDAFAKVEPHFALLARAGLQEPVAFGMGVADSAQPKGKPYLFSFQAQMPAGGRLAEVMTALAAQPGVSNCIGENLEAHGHSISLQHGRTQIKISLPTQPQSIETLAASQIIDGYQVAVSAAGKAVATEAYTARTRTAAPTV